MLIHVSGPVLLSLASRYFVAILHYGSTALTLLVSPGDSWTDYDYCSIQQPDDRAAVVSTTVFHHCGAAFTGCVSQNAFNFIWPFLYSTATRDNISSRNTADNDSRRLVLSASSCKMTYRTVGYTSHETYNDGDQVAAVPHSMPARRHLCTIFHQFLKRLNVPLHSHSFN